MLVMFKWLLREGFEDGLPIQMEHVPRVQEEVDINGQMFIVERVRWAPGKPFDVVIFLGDHPEMKDWPHTVEKVEPLIE